MLLFLDRLWLLKKLVSLNIGHDSRFLVSKENKGQICSTHTNFHPEQILLERYLMNTSAPPLSTAL